MGWRRIEMIDYTDGPRASLCGRLPRGLHIPLQPHLGRGAGHRPRWTGGFLADTCGSRCALVLRQTSSRWA